MMGAWKGLGPAGLGRMKHTSGLIPVGIAGIIGGSSAP